MIASAEAGSAWTLIYPQYMVVNTKPGIATFPLGFEVAKGSQDLLNFLNNWLQIKKNSQQVKAVYDFWILGQGAVSKKPSWSVIRNVLKLVK